jgi:hypothetical protein
VNYKEKAKVADKAAKEMGMTYPVALDGDGRIFEKFARGGVTRNIILDENLNIIFLTRLFEKEEFNEMKSVIKKQLNNNSEKKAHEINKYNKLIQKNL